MQEVIENSAFSNRPTNILCLPSAGNNPYQSLLYQEIPDNAKIVFAGPDGLGRLNAEDYSVVHIHWDDRMFGRTENAEENYIYMREKLEDLKRFKSAGGRIVWTVHNRKPHKERDLDTFRKGREGLVKLADGIHVHADHAADYLVSEFGADRSKISVIPHPSYLDAYEPRHETLGRFIAPEMPRNFLFFGMFRGDKGIHEIRDAAGKLTKREYTFNLRMYGKAFGSQARLLRLLKANSNVDLRTDRIPDEEVPEIFGSSHFFLAPYRSLFTSGSVMLALTFGLPVIGPNIRELKETTPEPCHKLLYDPDSPRGFIRSMIASVELAQSDLVAYRNACFEFAKDRAPETVSREIATLLNIQSSKK